MLIPLSFYQITLLSHPLVVMSHSCLLCWISIRVLVDHLEQIFGYYLFPFFHFVESLLFDFMNHYNLGSFGTNLMTTFLSATCSCLVPLSSMYWSEQENKRIQFQVIKFCQCTQQKGLLFTAFEPTGLCSS